MKDIQERWKDRWWGRLKLQILSTLDLGQVGGGGGWVGGWGGELSDFRGRVARLIRCQGRVGVGSRPRRGAQGVDTLAFHPSFCQAVALAHLFSESTGTVKRGASAAKAAGPSLKVGEPLATLAPWALSSTMMLRM